MIIYIISYNIEPRYNGTRLYIKHHEANENMNIYLLGALSALYMFEAEKRTGNATQYQ